MTKELAEPPAEVKTTAPVAPPRVRRPTPVATPAEAPQPAATPDMQQLMRMLQGTLSSLDARLNTLALQQQEVKPATAAPDVAQTSLMRLAANTSRPQGYRFLLVVLPEDGHPRCEEFAVIEDLIARMKLLIGTPCYLTPVIGQRLGITKGKDKFLTTAFGNFPLFDVPGFAEADETTTGWVGSVDIESVEPLRPADTEPEDS